MSPAVVLPPDFPLVSACRSRGHKVRADGSVVCRACRDRAQRRGLEVPAPPAAPDPEQMRPAWEGRRAACRARVEDYAELTQDFRVPRREAISRISISDRPISERTAERYEARLKQGESR